MIDSKSIELCAIQIKSFIEKSPKPILFDEYKRFSGKLLRLMENHENSKRAYIQVAQP